jgi:membrane protease YdiL (CAAX protease family)
MRAALSTRATDPVAGCPADRAAGRVSGWVLPVALSAALAWYNNAAGQRSWHRRWYPLANGCAAAALLTVAAGSGLTADDLGLGRGRLRSGLRLGAVAAAPVLAAYAAAVVIPAVRPVLRDERVANLTGGQRAYHVLLRIPVGTVAWEEIAFRGVLAGALLRVLPEPGATAWGSAVFGAWHIRPTAQALAGNGLAVGRIPRLAAVTGAVAATGAAGAFLSVLRGRSGSLAAPVIVHLAANCGGPLASALAARLDRRYEIITQ